MRLSIRLIVLTLIAAVLVGIELWLMRAMVPNTLAVGLVGLLIGIDLALLIDAATHRHK